MKIKLSDYVANFLADNNITDVFTVTGGGAMHLNDSLGHHPKLTCLYNHHEQASAIAAEAYARIENKVAAVCVTTGPGGTNAITGVLGGWLDSIPMLIISGQVRYDTSARGMNLNLRAAGDQEFDIVKSISCMTKYSEMIENPLRIRYALEKSLYLATHGRPGPCWIDIPVNFQGSIIETDDLIHYNPSKDLEYIGIPKVKKETITYILKKLKEAERPIFYSGNGIRLANAFKIFERIIPRLNIPVVTGWDNIDMVENNNPLYAGRAGIMGDRSGNFAVQNSDFILAVGNRLSIRQVGYNWKTWAREAYVVMVDIDGEELKKPTIHVELPVQADALDFLCALESQLPKNRNYIPENGWQEHCRKLVGRYPVVCEHHYATEQVNVYAFINEISCRLPENYVTVVGNGSACVVGSHGYYIKKGQRFLINSAVASMGYDLPAAIGACKAIDKKELVCITGDGSIQMNLQELQTIIANNLPIKIVVINNNGYHSIRQTQTNLFGDHSYVGIGPESGDLSFPEMEKIASAYGYPYVSIHKNSDISTALTEVFSTDGPIILEVFVSSEQVFEPKSATKRLPDGSLVSPPLEDLAPFLTREELGSCMMIPLVSEDE